MSKILGYGEDALTLWTLKNNKSKILDKFNDETNPSDCLTFYRPSFGRRGGKNSAEFGEFDAILVSLENLYLIESKWDNLTRFRKDSIIIRPEQKLRHRILSWYVLHWDSKYSDNWNSFLDVQKDNFENDFRKEKKIFAPNGSLLATNLQFILNKIQGHCLKLSEQNIKNVLLFFYNEKKNKPLKKDRDEFNLINIDYSKEIKGNFIVLD